MSIRFTLFFFPRVAAKRSPERRFHALMDRIWRRDVLQEAWRHVKRNRGSAGVDYVIGRLHGCSSSGRARRARSCVRAVRRSGADPSSRLTACTTWAARFGYLLDANATITLLYDASSLTAKRARRHKPRDVGISAIAAHELYLRCVQESAGRAMSRSSMRCSSRFLSSTMTTRGTPEKSAPFWPCAEHQSVLTMC